MKTAVEWLEKRFLETEGNLYEEDFEQAKEMEKAQKAKEYLRGYNNSKQFDTLLEDLQNH